MSYSPNSNSVNELLQGLEKAGDTSFYPPEETIHDVMKGQSPGQHDAIEGERAAKKERQRLEHIKTMQGRPMDKDDVLHGGGDNKTRRAQNEMAEIRKKEKARKKEDLSYDYDPQACLDWGIFQLERLGITELLLNTESKLAGGGIELAYESNIEPQFDKGFNPHKFKIFRPITCTGQLINGEKVLKYIKDRLDDANGYNQDYKKEWLRYLSGNDKNGELANNIKSYGFGHIRSKSLTADNNAHKVVPPLHWFHKKVLEIDVVNEILSLWDLPEREALMIMIGRALAGAGYEKNHVAIIDDTKNAVGKTTRVLEKFEDDVSGEYVTGGMKHTARSIPVLCGAAGVGKSHFMDNLRNAIDNLGFTNAVVPLSGNQFGWGKAKSVDIMFADDTGKDDFAKIYKSSQTKTVASAGTFADEDKGENVKTSRATASLFIATNEIWIPSPDKGCSSRFEFLQVRNKNTLTLLYKGKNYEEHLKSIAKKHGTNVEVMFMYLCRLCLDKFIETIGYQYNISTKQFDKIASSSLEKRLGELREMFTYQGKVHPEEMLVDACFKVQAMNTKLSELGVLKNFPNKQYPNPRKNDNYNISIEHVLQVAETLNSLKAKCASMEQPNSDELLPHIAKDKAAINYYITLQKLINWILPEDKFDHSTIVNFYNSVKIDITNSGKNIDKHALWDKYIGDCGTFYSKCHKNAGFYKNHWNSALSNKESYEAEFMQLMRESKLTPMAVSTIAKAVSVFVSLNRVVSKEEIHEIEMLKYFQEKKRKAKMHQEKARESFMNAGKGEDDNPETNKVDETEYIDITSPDFANIVNEEIKDYSPEEIAEVKEFKRQNNPSNVSKGSGTNGNSGRKGFAMKNRVAQAPIQGF
jgi:hypothetical protein